VYSVTRFRNRRLAHVASCQPDTGAWHRLYTSALLWSQDSWLSFFTGTSYKDHQGKRRCVREKFTEWSLGWLMIAFITCNSNLVPFLEGLCNSNPCRFEFSIFWVFAGIVPTTSGLTVPRSDELRFECSNFTSKNVIYVVHVLVKRSKTFKNLSYLFSRLMWISVEYDRFQGSSALHLTTLMSKLQRHLTFLREIWITGKFGLHTKKNIFPETSKIRRNSGNPKKTEIFVFSISKNRFDNFTKSI